MKNSNIRRNHLNFALQTLGFLAAVSQPALGDQIIAVTSTSGGMTGDIDITGNFVLQSFSTDGDLSVTSFTGVAISNANIAERLWANALVDPATTSVAVSDLDLATGTLNTATADDNVGSPLRFDLSAGVDSDTGIAIFLNGNNGGSTESPLQFFNAADTLVGTVPISTFFLNGEVVAANQPPNIVRFDFIRSSSGGALNDRSISGMVARPEDIVLEAGFALTDIASMTVTSTTTDVQDVVTFSVSASLPPDTDGDGMFDFYETANGLNPNDPADGAVGIDSDGDGLDNIVEFNSDPRLPAGNPDADADGLTDGEEVNGTHNPYQSDVAGSPTGMVPGLSTDPLDADSDDDGLSDGDELLSLTITQPPSVTPVPVVTNPLTNDTDGDADGGSGIVDDFLLTDGAEVAANLDPTDPTGINGFDGDPDGDDLINADEVFFGTNPFLVDSDADDLSDIDEIDIYSSNPINPDSDGDKILDGEEVFAGVDGFISDPIELDSDFDGVPDPFEILENTDPDLSSASPNYASISWSVAAVDTVGAAGIRNDGTLVYAEHYGVSDLAAPVADLTANGVTFTGFSNGSTPRCSDNVLTLLPNNSTQGAFYEGPVAELNPLFDSIWFSPDALPIPHLLLTGLTVGEDYFVQFGVSDDRAGAARVGRYVILDDSFGGTIAADPLGATNTIYGGPDNSALIFTGTFTATTETQMFDYRVFNSVGVEVANFLPFLQVRIDDGSVSGPTEIVIVDCGFNGDGDFVIELATSATGATVSESPNLTGGSFSPIAAASVTITGNTITVDGAAIDTDGNGSSFFQVSF